GRGALLQGYPSSTTTWTSVAVVVTGLGPNSSNAWTVTELFGPRPVTTTATLVQVVVLLG
ncbi:MAG: hypothetical protein M3P30_13810, partial [Chloroflexota bacterium]|nr:hypothetical protein [Chloroflexota bacterium]